MGFSISSELWFLLITILIVNFVFFLIILRAIANKSGKSSTAPAKQTASVAESAPAHANIAQETVAVITAAVAAMMAEESPGTAYTITGIRRTSVPGRPVWGFAGMQQNTRSL